MATNPLLKFSTIPDFKNIKPADCAQAITQVVGDLDDYLAQLPEIKSVSWDNFWLPYVEAVAAAERVQDQIAFITGTRRTLTWGHLLARIEDRYSGVLEAIHEHPCFINNLVKLSKKRLTIRQKEVIKFELQHHRRQGALLPAADRKLLDKCHEQLGVREEKFYNNYIKAVTNKKYGICVRREALLGEMPEDIKSIYRNGKNSWVFDLTNDSYANFMKYCVDRPLRKKMYYKYHTLCSTPDSSQDNIKLMREITGLRQEVAQLQGYANATELMFSLRRGQTAAKAKKLLKSVLREIRAAFKRELRQVSPAVRKELNITTPQLWDIDIINQKLRANRYHNHGEEFREYFALDQVLLKMLELAERVYGIRFKQHTVSGRGKDILYFKVFDAQTDAPMGVIGFDLLKRKNKDCMTYCQATQRGAVVDGHQQLAVTNVVTNFLAPADKTPILLGLDDLSMLFHETGHAIHELCLVRTNYEYPVNECFFFDEAEMPSQFFERFAYEWKFMKEIGRHYLYDKPLPKKLFDSTAGGAFTLLRKQCLLEYICLALFELEAHERDEDVLEIYRRVSKKCFVLTPPNWDRRCARFILSFGSSIGGYYCNYYGYLWSDMYAADLSNKFFKHKNLTTGVLGRQFRKDFLEYRFPQTLSQTFNKFMGRPVNPHTFLKFYSTQAH